jgi:hypothetical protein
MGIALPLSCKRKAATEQAVEEEEQKPSSHPSKPHTGDVFVIDSSGLTLKGPIPREGGGLAWQSGDEYREMRGGVATIERNGLVVWLSEKAIDCSKRSEWPREMLSFPLVVGPDGKFFAGRVASTIGGGYRGYGHVKVDPFVLEAGQHVSGMYGYSDPGSMHHNSFVVLPSRAAGRFDVPICPFSAAEKRAVLEPPAGLSSETPVSVTAGSTSFVPRSALLRVVQDVGDLEPYVEDMKLFEEPHVDCTQWFGAGGKSVLVRVGMETADLGAAQSAAIRSDAETLSLWTDTAWIRFDPFDLATATTAKGALGAWGYASDDNPSAKDASVLEPEMMIGGKFDALVCHDGEFFGKERW